MRLLADSNSVAPAVRELRAAGHDVDYLGMRETDPGDRALLAEAMTSQRAIITKDRDFGALTHRDGIDHFGILLIDDLGDAAAEAKLLVQAVQRVAELLRQGRFVRVRGPAL